MSEAAHLLVVDDDERLLALLQRFLSRSGHLVSVAADTSRAKEKIRSLDFDLIVLDVMLPGQDGIAFTAELRRTTDVPILLLTAKGEGKDRIAGLEAGADDYLVKPFEPRELLLRIATHPPAHARHGAATAGARRCSVSAPSASISAASS